MPQLHFVKKARKDNKAAGVKAGESYYWAAFRVGRSSFKKYWKERPKRSELTMSAYYAQIYDIEDALDWQGSSPEDLQSRRDDLVSELESLKDETQSSLDNMPEHLQESSSSGELLTARVEALENTISEYESIDLDYDELEDADVENDLRAEDEELEITADVIADKKAELEREWLDEKIGELEAVELQYE